MIPPTPRPVMNSPTIAPMTASASDLMTLAVLAVVFSHSLFALLFGLLCVRMVMAIVVSGSMCKAEVANYIEACLHKHTRSGTTPIP